MECGSAAVVLHMELGMAAKDILDSIANYGKYDEQGRQLEQAMLDEEQLIAEYQNQIQ